MSETSRQFFEAQSTELYNCFKSEHKVEEAAHIDHEEFVFFCRTCDKVYAVITERIYLPEENEY